MRDNYFTHENLSGFTLHFFYQIHQEENVSSLIIGPCFLHTLSSLTLHLSSQINTNAGVPQRIRWGELGAWASCTEQRTVASLSAEVQGQRASLVPKSLQNIDVSMSQRWHRLRKTGISAGRVADRSHKIII